MFSILYGNSTFKNWSYKATCFVVSQPSEKGEYSDLKFPGSVLQEVRGGRINTPSALDAFQAHGMWTQTSIDCDDEKIIMVKVDFSRHGSVYAQAVTLINTRKDADYLKVKAVMPHHNNSALGEEKMPAILFQGRGDIITKEELGDYNIVLRGNILSNYFDPVEASEVVKVEVVDKGTPKPTTEIVVKDSGEEVRVRKDQPVRKITVRRGRRASA